MDSPDEISFDSFYAKIRVRHDDPRDLPDPAVNRQFIITVLYRSDPGQQERTVDEFPLKGTTDDIIELLTTMDVRWIPTASRLMLPSGGITTSVQRFDPGQVRAHLQSNANPVEVYIDGIDISEVEERVRWWKHQSGFTES